MTDATATYESGMLIDRQPVEPTSFVHVGPEATISREEIFGPVLAVIPGGDEHDAVRIANNSKYGLSGTVETASNDRAMPLARRMRTGTLCVHGGSWFQPDVPDSGHTQSEIGRENGEAGYEERLELEAIGPRGAATGR